MDILEFYQKAKDLCIKSGYQDEIDWVEKRKLEDQNVTTFFGEYMYVVVNSGMKNAVAEEIYRRAIKAGMSAIGHPEKRKALQLGMKMKEQWWAEFKEKKTLDEQLAYLESLPWIGPITKYHLARNPGLDVAKPDRHMVRLAYYFNFPNVQKMCEYVSRSTGDRVGTVDVVLWRITVLHNGNFQEVMND
jgi:hypothetical protein